MVSMAMGTVVVVVVTAMGRIRVPGRIHNNTNNICIRMMYDIRKT